MGFFWEQTKRFQINRVMHKGKNKSVILVCYVQPISLNIKIIFFLGTHTKYIFMYLIFPQNNLEWNILKIQKCQIGKPHL